MVQVRVDVWDSALDAEQLDELTSGLRLELLDAGVPSVPAADDAEPPPGARAVDVAAIGSVIVTLAGGIALLRETLTLELVRVAEVPSARVVRPMDPKPVPLARPDPR